ncbi:MAG: hypothetical protein JWR00_1156 [Rubritepida sp.]|nr:hypothetical protein [Rubritepida sp.]
MPMQCTVIDLDGSLTGQPALAAALASGEAKLVSARDLARRLRIVASRKALAELEARLAAVTDPDAPGRLIFYGSGDFHHLCAVFLRSLREPFLLLHFDNHPDWTTFPATMNCGGWVNRALEQPQLERVVTIGASGSDFVRPQLKWANFAAIREGRLEVHPWRAQGSWLLGRRIAARGCHTMGSGPFRRLIWHGIGLTRWPSFAEGLDRRLPALPLWVTLDKDVLRTAEAVTNWEQGRLSLQAILDLLARLGARRRILGIDVCGDYSPPTFGDPFRAFLSATDRPSISPDLAAARAVNDATNARILTAARALLR